MRHTNKKHTSRSSIENIHNPSTLDCKYGTNAAVSFVFIDLNAMYASHRNELTSQNGKTHKCYSTLRYIWYLVHYMISLEMFSPISGSLKTIDTHAGWFLRALCRLVRPPGSGVGAKSDCLHLVSDGLRRRRHPAGVENQRDISTQKDIDTVEG